jgi:hypothetical protein
MKKPSQRIWTGPNLDQVEFHRKNLCRLYSTKNLPQGLSFWKVNIFILLMAIPSQRSQVRQFRIELSLVEGIISSFFFSEGNLKKESLLSKPNVLREVKPSGF